ncbi:MAG: Txe/YoeB family addiction module toxin [Synergistaceae bacterium]|nr:Txe/YoeB family addiction module toxin [Synergistaceae bacterium]MBR0044685.1 Txe/YoeB family addiction module toxin [Synergistaceae bacterium]MBR0221139.1 Txe/YoeB family addiction module toxin [Synergistaceae bacterium]
MSWTLNNRKFVKRINDLIQDIQRNGLLEGIGKPERLKHSPNYSRRIDKSNRLIYRVENGYLYIVSCKGHYEEED